MENVSTQSSGGEWGSDFFGTLNDMPEEPVAGIANILDAMATLPAFRDARQWMLRNLGLPNGGAILEAGCGNGASLDDVRSTLGSNGRIVGIDPTKAFVEAARARTAGRGAVTYEVGDIRSIPFADGEFDAAFCDKVLIHAGPASAALREMGRVTRPGGRVGAVEWLPFFMLSSTGMGRLEAFNEIFPKALYDYTVSLNLARHFHAAGMKEVRVSAFLAQTESLEAHPFWRAFLVHQMPMFIHAGLIAEDIARSFLGDIERLDQAGELSASFVVHAAVGTKQ